MRTHTSIDQIKEENRAAGLDVDYMQAGKGEYRGAFLEAVHGTSTFVSESTSVAITVLGEVDKDIYFVLGGNEAVIADGKESNRRELLIYPPGSDFFIATRGACSVPQIMLSNDLVDDYLNDVDPLVSTDNRRSPVEVEVSPAISARFRSTVWGLARTEAACNSHAQDLESFLLPFITREVDLACERGRPAADYKLKFEAARTYIVDNLVSAIGIADVCAATQTPMRTLHRAFLRHCGMSPKQFLQVCRLNAVWRELSTSEYPGVTVSATARKYRFNHLGRFSSTYKRFYGEYPKATLARKGSTRIWPSASKHP